MNEKEYYEDIICARATPSGTSAIAIIRVSGKNSWNLLKIIFKSSKKSITFKTHHSYYGNIINKDQIIDDVLATTFKEGSSFTGEESFEISCHGSEIIISLIMNILIENGARFAEPGEFSKRAFLNGKIDLTKAEAIMDIVNASTQKSALIAVQQLTGRLTGEINEIKNKLADLLASVEVMIDYPEEDITEDTEIWEKNISELNVMLENLLKGFVRGKLYREGIRTVILGKTNSGKSTLFNFLLNDDKAIVSSTHGTTRDYIDGMINICGFGVRLFDTAGLRETNDPIEKEGTRRSKKLSEKADIILYMINGETGFTDEDKANILQTNPNKKMIVIINKIDILNDSGENIYNQITDFFKTNNRNFRIVKMSALNKIGLNDFNEYFAEILTGKKIIEGDDPVLTNARHANLIEQTRINLINAYQNLDSEMLDLVAFELREGLDHLGEITGEITPQDILNKIFSSFCVGK
jgi:tRNA modification GTPase